ncbi:ATP-dependent DNA helicase PIF1-like protein [Tanacetum coccineum]
MWVSIQRVINMQNHIPHKFHIPKMKKFSRKRISNMAYQQTPTRAGSSGRGSKGYRQGRGYGGSKGFGGFGSSGGSVGDDRNKKITPISKVDPMLDNIAIQGSCISIWHLHRLNAAHDTYSLDLVLQDAQNNRIHIYIKKEFMFRFEPLFEEGKCYIVSNFGIAENGRRLPLLPHDPEHHQYYEQDAMGTSAIHNALFRSKIFINRDLPEIATFRTRVQDRDKYDANQWNIERLSPEVKVVTVAEFFHRSIKKMVGGICECEPVLHCIVYATIHRIHKEHGWAYTACKSCNKRVDIITHSNRKPTFVCEDHGNVQVASRFKELMEKCGMDLDDYFPEDLDDIVGKKALFKHFKKDFLADDVDYEQADEAPDEVNMCDSSINRVLDMKTPSKDGSGRRESSGAKKWHVFIDLDDLDTESEDDEGNSNAEDIVKVKVEPKEQILLIIPNGSRQDVVHATINASYLWEHCTVMNLTVNMRLGSGATDSERKEIQDFADWILDIGNGNIGGKNDGESTVEFSDNMLIPESDDQKRRYTSLRILFSVAGVDDTNFNLDLYTTYFLNTIRMSGVPHHMSALKIGAPVMCMRNIDQKARLCNGTRLQILGTGINIIEGKIISGGKVGEICAIPHMVITPTDNKMPFK